jgi:hypothetical protein
MDGGGVDGQGGGGIKSPTMLEVLGPVVVGVGRSEDGEEGQRDGGELHFGDGDGDWFGIEVDQMADMLLDPHDDLVLVCTAKSESMEYMDSC